MHVLMHDNQKIVLITSSSRARLPSLSDAIVHSYMHSRASNEAAWAPYNKHRRLQPGKWRVVVMVGWYSRGEWMELWISNAVGLTL